MGLGDDFSRTGVATESRGRVLDSCNPQSMGPAIAP